MHTDDKQRSKDISAILGFDDSMNCQGESSPLSKEEKQKRLRAAQNVNRGHPRKGEQREPMKQINITCPISSSEELDSISFRTGKTKRSLMEEAIKHLARKYVRD